MIHIFDGKVTPELPTGSRLPITWHGIDYNKALADANGIEVPEEGIYTEAAGFNTPVNFQSEVHPDIVKNGGGIELYNPRVGSRVLQIRAHVRARTLSRLGAILAEIQDDFSPLELMADQSAVGLTFPPPAGRPLWSDPWSAQNLPLQFTRMNDGSETAQYATAFPSGEVQLQYNVVPLELPDPPISTIQTGYGAELDLSFLVMDGGRAFARTASSRTGSGVCTQVWAQAPDWPEITFTMAGAGSATFTLTVTGVTGYSPTALVLDLSALTNEAVKINCRDRRIYLDGVLDMSPYVSGDYPIVTSVNDPATFTYTNTTNTGTITTTWREASFA